MTEEAESMAEGLVSRLDATEYRTVVCVEEGRSRQISDRWEAVRAAIEDAGRVAVVLDGERREGLYEVLSRWLEFEGGAEETRTGRLFDYLTMAMDMGCEAVDSSEREELIVDAMVRLVEQLVTGRGAVLVVLHPGKLATLDRRALDSMMWHFLDDPLAEIDPGAGGDSPVGFVWAGSPEELPAVKAESAVSIEERMGEIRRFLRRDSVVERLLDTTQGDRRRLEALFDGLPDSVARLWTRRIAELSPAQRDVVRYLAVAQTPLEISFLDRYFTQPVIGVVRDLCDRGVVVRSMDDGVVRVGLASTEIGNGVVEELTESERTEIHLMLATAAVERGGEDGVFIAQHALAGGDGVTGVRFGLPAVRGLLRQGRWERAQQLLSRLRKIEEAAPEARKQILSLSLRLSEARSAWREALSLSETLHQVLEDDNEKTRTERRRATYLMKIGRLDAAEDRFRAILDERDEGVEYCRAMLGLAEICYERGDHEGASRWADKAQRQLSDGDATSDRDDELLVEAANIGGKAALYRGEMDEAWKRFEEAAGGARRIGLHEEAARAEVNLGVVAVQRRRYEEARRRLKQALEKAELAGGTLRLNCWLNLGIVHQRRGEFSTALEHYRRSLREAKRRGDDVASQVAVHNLATLYQDLGAFDAATRLVADTAEDSTAQGGDDGFAGRWAAMTRAQILLKQGRARQALEALEKAERQLTDDQRLYGREMRLRRAMAHLKLGELDRASEVIDEVGEGHSSASPQVQILYRFYAAAVARRQGRAPEESVWRSIIGELEALGMFQDAAEARMELVAQLQDQSGEATASAEWLVEQGIEDLRQRLKTVPERFSRHFLGVPVHRQMVQTYRELMEAALPEELKAVCDTSSEAVVEESDEKKEQEERDEAAYRRWRARYGDIVGEDSKMLHIFRIVDRVAPSETTVLLAGESGTGKELVAEAIHDQSERDDAPFVRVNCAAFVEELLLSELFGHEKGAFTGAVETREGRFERADGGTIFLDEIGDISPKTQVALLRVLQQGTFERVGGTSKREVDVRVVAATNRDLDEMVREGKFRLDLYYRLKGFLIEMPPLRRRREDIPQLLHHFASEFANGESVPRFSDEAVQFLAQYRWPGNVRELENFVRSALLFSDGQRIDMEHLAQFREFFSEEEMDTSLPPVDTTVDVEEVVEESGQTPIAIGEPEEALVEEVIADERSLSRLKKRLEKKCIKAALRQTDGNITQAARILQMKRPRLSQIVNGDEELVALKKELVG